MDLTLRDEYHSQSGEDGADTIRIVKFLRDFVIDFGPADLDGERLKINSTTASCKEEGEEHSAATHINNESEDVHDAGKGTHARRDDSDHSKIV
ncbi:hypothetical protein RSOLAG22IIIB_09259 [Rhizoctonia solani]|uniref:Uncharacterized protein n=1 Tax=Rhizoctonia solani TaxID=456999 RepID=A0A0K6FXJ3_9AGAM|nr:hypothetical protein RSOLAG22IIIB_09259 [Rhizoctonia solani]